MDEEIRRVLAVHSRIRINTAELAEDDDLFAAGMTSHANINVMLALEDAFDIEFPESMLRRSTFETIAAIREAITCLHRTEVAS